MSLSTVVSSAIAIAKEDALKYVAPSVITFINSMAETPTKLNLAVQLVILEGAVLKALPTIEQDELKALSAVLTAEVTQALSAPAPAATAAPAAAAAVAGKAA